MKESRGFVRLSAPVEAMYTVLPDGRPQRTLTKDLGAGGARLIMDKSPAPGTHVQMAFTLPGRSMPVNAIAEVVWSGDVDLVGRSDRRRSAEVGVRMTEIAPQDHAALVQFVTDGLRSGPPASVH